MIARVWTIGHSTRKIDIFLSLSKESGIKLVADVRMFPGSKRYPQFGRESLAKSLAEAGIRYQHCPELGGRRKAKPDSKNTAWRNESFRGYADYMQTPAFAEHLAEVIDLAKSERVALMCAEAVPWRCHRSLIADALVARGIAVEEIVSETRRTPHKLTPFARVDGPSVTYPAIDGAPAG